MNLQLAAARVAGRRKQCSATWTGALRLSDSLAHRSPGPSVLHEGQELMGRDVCRPCERLAPASPVIEGGERSAVLHAAAR